jgi:hypothetical protein
MYDDISEFEYYHPSQAVGSPMIGCPSPLPAAGVSLTHVALAGGDEVQAGCISAVNPTLDLIAFHPMTLASI